MRVERLTLRGQCKGGADGEIKLPCVNLLKEFAHGGALAWRAVTSKEFSQVSLSR